MKIVEQRLLRGPNIYSNGRVFTAVVDLEDLDDVPSTAVPDFVDRLLALVPTLDEHRCSVGTRGGFIHVPWLPEQGTPGMALDDIVRGLRLALRCALQVDKDAALGAGATN